MSKYDPSDENIDDLLQQVDSLIRDDVDPGQQWDDEDYFGSDGFPEYIPASSQETDQMFYQNHANDYGRQVRNYHNGYGGGTAPREREYTGPSIPAYNADFDQPSRKSGRPSREAARKKAEYRDYGYIPEPEPPRKKPAPRRRRGCGCTTVLLCLAILVAMVVGVVVWAFQPPRAEVAIGPRKEDTASILICGTDADGGRTDTMMLLYLSGSERQVSLLSLPRDSRTITSSGSNAKLNSAYGRNGQGQEGMEGLMDYVENIIGYRPDGYILVDMTLVPQFVDIMGGVDIEVPMDMEVDGMSLSAGMQHLDGSQVLTLLRFRKGYATADLGRVEMQRAVLKACIDQWVSVEHITDAFSAMNLVQSGSLSSMNTRNYLWIGKTLLLNMSGGFATETLPGVPDYIGDASYYILDLEDVAELINQSFNPYLVTIRAEDLSITGE